MFQKVDTLRLHIVPRGVELSDRYPSEGGWYGQEKRIMRKILVFSTLILFGLTMAGCRYCDGLRRGSMTQPWNAPTMPYCDSCTTCAPESPCGVCDSCTSDTSIMTTTTKAPTIMPAPN